MIKRINDAIERLWPWWRHPRSMRFMGKTRFDLWHWGLGLRVWFNGAPGFHFDDTGIELHLGPLYAMRGITDTN